MWPLDLPAEAVLQLPAEAGPLGTALRWAEFNPAWYRQTYAKAADQVAADDPAALRRYYLDHGQQQGHAPNELFDEVWHRQAYPQIAERIAAGDYASAFDAYCRRGSIDRSPHWLFDEIGYRRRNPDVTSDILASTGLANGYDHYLRHGNYEDRAAHALFEPAVYLANFDAADVPAIRRHGVFQHYLRRLRTGEPELPTTRYFDPVWYRHRYPDVAAAIDQGRWLSALHHYLCNETPTAFDPHESFSEAHYLARDPGLRDVIVAREFRNGYAHFLGFGARELRSPTPSIDLVRYAAQPQVSADLAQGTMPDAYTHWLAIGRHQTAPAGDDTIAAPLIRVPSHAAATALLPLAGRFGYSFECVDEPLASVVLVVRDRFAATMATIASLRGNVIGDIELILVDCGSQDETRVIDDYVPGAKLLRFESDVGWSQAATAGGQLATAGAILLLAAESQLAPGAIDHACVRLAGDPSIGAVGGMVIRPTGEIAQAGGILWRDGTTQDYLRGASPLAPEANFVRSVDFCLPAFLLVRAALLTQLGGLDPDCADTASAGIDICIRIIQAGARVIYDPSVVLFHDDRERTGRTHDQPNRPADPHVQRKHAAYLAEQAAPAEPLPVFARHTGLSPPRLLFIEDTVPLRRIGSGFVRSNDLLRVMDTLGYQVTVYPINGCTHDPARVFADMPDTVEVMHDHAADGFAAFLAGRIGYYDVVWIARVHNLDRIRPDLSLLEADGAPRPLIVLDTEAIAPLRQAEQARLAGHPYDQDAALRADFANAGLCDAVIAVSPQEAATLRAIGLSPVLVLGHMIEPRPTLRPFAQRAGLLFVGAIHDMDSPNFDSLVWFVEAVLPLIEQTLGWETRLTIAGYTAPRVDLGRFASHPRITLRHAVADLDPLYDAHRLFVAPTRYAAGLPYKVFEAASRGVPVVTTDLLRDQLGWAGGSEILSAGAADPAAFAATIITLYRDEDLWRTIREGALQRLRQDSGRVAYSEAVSRVLDTMPER